LGILPSGRDCYVPGVPLKNPSGATGARSFEWAGAIVCRNERKAIGHCLRAVAAASVGHSMHVSVLVNGSSDASLDVARQAAGQLDLPISIYDIRRGCKSNAINQYLYGLRPVAKAYFFTDGYTQVDIAALRTLDAALADHPDANAATAVPSVGRSAAASREAMLRHGGLHGSLFALRSSFVDRLVARGLHLPVGLYRGDGLIGSLAMHDLDARTEWQTRRVVVTPATWRQTPLSVLHSGDLVRYGRRLVRQAQGRMENAAIKAIIYERGYEALPNTVAALIGQWLTGAPEQTPMVWRSPLGAYALRALRHEPPARPEDLAAKLVFGPTVGMAGTPAT